MKYALDQVVDLRSVAVLIVLCVAFVGSVFAYAFLVRGNYYAVGLLRYEQPAANFRRLVPQLVIEQAFVEWASTRETADAEAARQLQKVFSTHDGVQRFISPFFRLTRRDVREAATPTKQQEGESELSGLEVTAFAGSPKEAVAMVTLGAEFIRDVALRDALLSYSLKERASAQTNSRLTENEAISRRFDVRQLELKRTELRRVRSAYPDSVEARERQLLSMSADGSRFLPPLVQLVGVESELIDRQRELTRLERVARQSKALEDFYVGAVQVIESVPSGTQALDAIESLRQRQLSKEILLEDEALKEIDNRIGITLNALRDAYVNGPVFISGDAVATGFRSSSSVLFLVGVLTAAAVWLVLLFGTRTLAWLKDGTRTTS